jgi:mono/diheme cytochrome c family protein
MRVLVLGFSLLILAACSGEVKYPARQVPDAMLSSQEAQQAGAKLFKANCAFCHGHLSEGRSRRANDYDPPPMDFYDDSYLQVDPAYLYWRIAKGNDVEPFRSQGSVMPSWEAHFSEDQIWQLVAFLRARAS